MEQHNFAGVPAPVTPDDAAAALEAELAAQAAQLTAIRNFAITVPLQGGGYGAYGTELDNFLRRHDLPRNGEVTRKLGTGLKVEYLNAAGLAAQLEEVKAAHALKIAAIRREAMDYQRQHVISEAQLASFFEAAGMEPAKTISRVELSGRVSWDSEDTLDQVALGQALQAALAGVAGTEVDTGHVNLTVTKVVA